MSRKNLQPFIPLFSLLVALAAGGMIIAATGKSPAEACVRMIRSTFGSGYGMGQVLFRTTTLVLAGLGVAIPFKVRLFNVGAEGQLLMGSFAAALCGMLLPQAVNPAIGVPATLFAAMAAGSLWASAAAWLKIRYGVNEVISTIMLNFVAQGITGFLLTSRFAVPSTVHTPAIVPGSMLPGLDALFGLSWHSPANLATLIALGASAAAALMLSRTRYGYTMKAAGLSPEAARHAGIDTDGRILGAMAMGGALAGLGAGNLVLGYKHWFEAGLTSGIGFMGIAVALLAGAHPAGILLSALLFGWLDFGGLAVNTMVPKEVFMIVQAVTILAIISFPAMFRTRFLK
jgi:general nucleoside transport system permease protein